MVEAYLFVMGAARRQPFWAPSPPVGPLVPRRMRRWLARIDPTYAYPPKDTYTPTVELQTEVRKSFWGPVGEQLSFGCVLGIATGFCLRKLGRMLMVVVGGEVLVLQYMAHRGWAHVGWDKMARDLSPALDGGRFRDSIGLLAYKMPFATAFTGAFGGSAWCRCLRSGRDTLPRLGS